MADSHDVSASSNPGVGAPSKGEDAGAGASSRDFKNPRQSGRKRSNPNKERGRNDWERKKGGKRGFGGNGGNGDWRELKRRKKNDADPDEAAKKNPNPFSKEEIEAEQKRPKRKVAVMVGYSGTGYKGMQINGDEPTIERDLFRAFIAAGAISKANADDPRKSSLVRCARTDKGVHAAGNVISLKLILEDDDVVEKINNALPDQIRVWGIQRTNNAFSCYQGCDSRWYEYLMPSYSLLPPNPNTYLGKKIHEYAKTYNGESELEERFADVKDFWTNVEETAVKAVLEGLDPEIRAGVLERLRSGDFESSARADASENKQEDTEKVASTENDNPASASEVTGAGEQGESNVAAEKSSSDVQATESNEDSTDPIEGSKQPKSARKLGPMDFALRDVKMAYVNAKRNYRISPERLQRLQEVLTEYVGTNNFHNYTVQKAFNDPSAKRHIKSFVVNPTPIIIGDTEWLSIKVHGQSFMMHQIRKMVGLASLVVRCGTPISRVKESYLNQKMAIPKAPGLGLLLERPVFDNYNQRATESLGKEEIDFSKYDEELEAFKKKHIYNRIFDVEERDNSFYSFFNQVDQFKQNHFLWVTAGGIDVAKIEGPAQTDVDKQLGDEDEDPEDPEAGEG